MPSISSGAHQLHHGGDDLNQEVGIRDVWRHNLEEEFVLIRKVVKKYCFVAMDTEFPGNFKQQLIILLLKICMLSRCCRKTYWRISLNIRLPISASSM